MRLITLGTGGYFPDPHRGAPAAAVLGGGSQFLVDAGEDVARAMVRADLAIESTSTIFLTHYHGDHISGLAPLLFALYVEASRGRPTPDSLTIVGPPGLENLRRGFLTAYGDWLLDPGFPITWREVMPPGEIGPAAGVKVRFERVEHASDMVCLGYRITEEDRVLGISGDATFCEGLLELARGADLFLCEAGKSMEDDNPAPHIKTKEIGELATEAEVQTLVLTHFIDPDEEERLVREIGEHFNGDLVAARDGDRFSV